MKKNKICKSFAIILSLMIALMILPAKVEAASLTVGTGGTYATLGAALAVANNGDKITLLSDVVETSNYTFDTTGKTVTLDGGNHKVTGANSTASESIAALKVTGSGTLELKNISFIGGSLSISTFMGMPCYNAGLWTNLSSGGRVCSIGTVNVTGGSVAISDTGELISVGLYNTGNGTVDITNATGADVDLTSINHSTSFNSYGLYSKGTGTVNLNSAFGGKTINSDGSSSATTGVYATTGVVNVNSSIAGDTVGDTGYGWGIQNEIGSKINANIAKAGNASTMSAGIMNNSSSGTGITNVGSVFLGTAYMNYSVVNTTGMTLNVGTIDSIGSTMGGYSYNATSTLTLNANGGSCVLSSITVAKTGSTTIGTLPGVSKNGVAGNWYTDSALTTLFTGTTVTGATTLYAGGWPVTTISDIPVTYSMNTGSKVVWEPQPAGGTWEWDHTFFTATFNSPATFTALKSGTSTISYTVDGVTQNISMTVAAATATEVKTSPKTGENMILIYASSLLAVTSFVGILYMTRRKVKKI